MSTVTNTQMRSMESYIRKVFEDAFKAENREPIGRFQFCILDDTVLLAFWAKFPTKLIFKFSLTAPTTYVVGFPDLKFVIKKVYDLIEKQSVHNSLIILKTEKENK